MHCVMKSVIWTSAVDAGELSTSRSTRSTLQETTRGANLIGACDGHSVDLRVWTEREIIGFTEHQVFCMNIM
jgi:hypothetical protein